MDRKHVKNILFFITVTLTTVMLGACSTGWEEAYRQEGYSYHQISYDLYPETPDFYKEVAVGDTVFHFCGSKKYFNTKYQDPNRGVVGYAVKTGNTDNNGHNHYTYHVYLLAKVYKGRIIYNPAILGHELGHIFNFKNNVFVNPDKFKELDELEWVQKKCHKDGVKVSWVVGEQCNT
jgi:hypothetical protein